MSNTYFRSKNKPTPIMAAMFPAKYMAILDITKYGLECKTSNKSFDLQKSLEEADEHKLEIINQRAAAYDREIAIHMKRGNRDHWLFTIQDPDTKEIKLDLVVSQSFLNRCVRNKLRDEFYTALMTLAAFTYEMYEGGLKYFIPIEIKSEDIN